MKNSILLLLLLPLFACTKNEPPVVSFLSPADAVGCTNDDILEFIISAEDPDGLVKEVRLMIDTVVIATFTERPFSHMQALTDYDLGIHTITAIAEDDDRLEGSGIIHFRIGQAPPITKITAEDIGADTVLLTGELPEEYTQAGMLEGIEVGFYLGTESFTEKADERIVVAPVGTDFSIVLQDLEYDTEYFVRAFSSNSFGEKVSEEVVFKTKRAGYPNVSIMSIFGETDSSFQVKGKLISDGNLRILEEGFYYSSDLDFYRDTWLPDENTLKVVGGGPGASFVATVTGLEPNTIYRARAYVINKYATKFTEPLKIKTKE